jgi:beta-lactamase superfamily II metal-dependent hydrolase
VSGRLRVRVYDVKFGDALLVTVPPDPTVPGDPPRHVLIDLGNAPFHEGSDKTVYLPIVEDVLRELGGGPLHAYLSTHEHMDHVQGLFHAARDLAPRDLRAELRAERVWLTASAAPDYAERFPAAKKKQRFHLAFFDALEALEQRWGRPAVPARWEALAANNHPRSTAACVDWVRGLAPAAPAYLHRGAPVPHALPGVTLRVLAPEEDTSRYYGAGGRSALWLDDAEATRHLALAGAPETVLPAAPAGVDATAFRGLWDVFRTGPLGDALLQIDRAANDTSVVLELAWRGWKLLFCGDAEERSWARMAAEGVLSPVHFLKVSHHGSHNGTPEAAVLDRVLPLPWSGPDRIAVVSTCANTYPGIPHGPTDDALRARCARFLKTSDPSLPASPTGARYLDLWFDPAGPA